MKYKLLLLTTSCALPLCAQDDIKDQFNPVMTAVVSQSIAGDARAASMGDLGAATDPDANSQYWNPSKYAFMESKGGITVNYTPWLTKLVNDINLAYIAGYYNIGEMAGTVSGSFRYFSMGEVTLMEMDANYQGSPLGTARPNEWALDVAYSRKLHEYLSMAVALRFMYSDMNNGSNTTTDGVSIENYPAWTFAADLSLYYRQPIATPMGESYFALGFNLSNLGGKMTYDEGDDEHGEGEACQDGEDGGELFGYGTGHAAICPILQEGVEENYEGCADHGGDAYEPQVETTEEQDDVFALGAVHLADGHFLLARTRVERDAAPNTHEADDGADACEYPRSALHVFK